MAERYFLDVNGGLSTEEYLDKRWTLSELQQFYEDEHEYDPYMKKYGSFDNWFEHFSKKYLKEIDKETYDKSLKKS